MATVTAKERHRMRQTSEPDVRPSPSRTPPAIDQRPEEGSRSLTMIGALLLIAVCAFTVLAFVGGFEMTGFRFCSPQHIFTGCH